MKTKHFNMSYLPESVTHNGKEFEFNAYQSGLHNAMKKHTSEPAYKDTVVIVRVLSSKVKGKTDLYGNPYKPIEYIFTLKQPNTMKTQDFTISANKGGYMISYKGYKIGGAGTLSGGANMRGKAAAKQTSDYYAMAQREIESILKGYGPQHYIKAILEIDPESFTDKQPTQ